MRKGLGVAALAAAAGIALPHYATAQSSPPMTFNPSVTLSPGIQIPLTSLITAHPESGWVGGEVDINGSKDYSIKGAIYNSNFDFYVAKLFGNVGPVGMPSYGGVSITVNSQPNSTVPLSGAYAGYGYYPDDPNHLLYRFPTLWNVNIPVGVQTPTFSVELAHFEKPGENDAIVALATAKNGPVPISLATAASELRVDHFNVIQVIVSDPDLTACRGQTGSGCGGLTTEDGAVAPNGTLDPPIGGWKYEADQNGGFPGADYQPFYYDEKNFTKPSADPYVFHEVAQTSINDVGTFTPTDLSSAMGFEFDDQPGQGHEGTSEFVDFLVGVKGNCDGTSRVQCDYIPTDADFEWTSTNGVVGYARNPKDPFMNAAALGPLGCSDQICGQSISLDEALALTGNTLDSFEHLGAATSAPEPSTWAMMIIGFVGLGYAGYRRSSAPRHEAPAPH
jgi:hypothetical protein